MSLTGDYDDQNIFARILRGELPAARVFEDEHTLALMDVFPQTRGHMLVIHKTARARNLLDAPPEAVNAIMATVQTVARAAVDALKPDGVLISQFNGAAAGQTIFHLHVHILPRWAGVELGRHGEGGMADTADLRALAGVIAKHLDQAG